ELIKEKDFLRATQIEYHSQKTVLYMDEEPYFLSFWTLSK
ncbi:unnamed protein product, partial [marine sediment metagenome]